ncbi:Crp/Fnr family transcriptional regulator [Cellvibrio sp. UBA7661]|uniref:Crp/Fnr family transcriptional regulator n=1 Tax=Cellvibrio sp. UBA7661 TaxID=1946311 RepID=UPI002F3512F6
MSFNPTVKKTYPRKLATNRLLDSLPEKLRTHMLKICEPVTLKFGTILCEPDKPLKYVYFPLSAFISSVTPIEGHKPLEISLVGNEGMLGATVSLGLITTPMRALVQGSGEALRLSPVQLRRELQATPRLVQHLNRYMYVLFEQLIKTAACIHFHEIEQRLARWLLMTHDRTYADQLHLTQVFLADMLGVRRSGVTIAAGALQAKNLIHYNRGEITILNRKGLEATSCKCYQIMIKDYEKIFS